MVQPRGEAGLCHPMGGAMDVLARNIVVFSALNHCVTIWAFPADFGLDTEIFWEVVNPLWQEVGHEPPGCDP